jgi:ribonuclease E
MRAPDGDPYVWLDPADVLGGGASQGQAPQSQSASPPERPEVLTHQGDLDIWVELPAKEDNGGRSGRNRRGRGRDRGRDRDRDRDRNPQASDSDAAPQNDETPHVIGALASEPEVIVAPEPTPVVSEAPAEPAAKPKRASRAKKVVEPVAEAAAPAPVEAPATEPVVEAKPKAPPKAKAAPKVKVEPVVPAEPDPAEISGPPPAAKRGWWRR